MGDNAPESSRNVCVVHKYHDFGELKFDVGLQRIKLEISVCIVKVGIYDLLKRINMRKIKTIE